MSKITFDQHGHLMPYEIIDLDLEAVKWHFVAEFGQSGHRKLLYQSFESLIEKLKNEIIGSFFILVDGSFVSTKENPADIDFVVFMPIAEFEKSSPLFQSLDYNRKQIHRQTGLHVFVSYFCSGGHPQFIEANALFDKWTNWFSHTKLIDGVALPKGIVRVKFNCQST